MMTVKMSNEKTPKKSNIFPTATLADVAVGDSCVIIACDLPPRLKSRFAEMGLTPETFVTVIRVAPLGCPMVIRARGYELCVRQDTARNFVVRPTI